MLFQGVNKMINDNCDVLIGGGYVGIGG